MSETSTAGNVRTWCVMCHLSALAGFVIPGAGHILGPLIVWLVKRGDSAEIDAHGKEALNFQISMLIYNVVAGILCLIVMGLCFSRSCMFSMLCSSSSPRCVRAKVRC